MLFLRWENINFGKVQSLKKLKRGKDTVIVWKLLVAPRVMDCGN